MSGQKTINTTTPSIGAIKIQQSTLGLVLPIVWGRTRITGNLLWYGNFKATPHTEVTQSGGKGGSAPRQTTTSYTYSASVAMGLCEGPILAIRTAWRGKKLFGGTTYSGAVQLGIQDTPYTGTTISVSAPSGWSDVSVERVLATDLQDDYKYYRANSYKPLVRGVDYTASAGVYTFTAGALQIGEVVHIKYTFISGSSGSSALSALGMDLYRGNPGQSPWPYLTTNFPSQALGYSSIAYVAAADYSLDDGAAVENHAFEVESIFEFSSTIPDANPGPVVLDALTNPQYGAHFGAEKIGSLSDYTAACTAQGIFLSPALTAQMTAAQFLSQMALLTNVGMVWSGGVLKFIPYTDVPLTGNGVTFTPNTAPIYDLTDDDFQPVDDDGPIKVTRGSVGDTFNLVTLEISDRANAYNVLPVPAPDQADIQENGLRAMPSIKADWVCDAAIGKTIAQLILQRSMFVRNTYEFKLGWTKIGLEPMDLVTLTDSGLGLNKQPVRILTMEEDEGGYLSVVAEDFPKGSASATQYPSASGSGFAHDMNESPGAIGAPVIFEAPAVLAGPATGLELWLAAGNNGATYGGCEVWVSLTGSNYQRAAVINGPSRFGITTSALAATSGTTTETVGVALTGGGQILAGTTADMNALSTLCFVGGEFIAYETATLTGSSAYTIGNHMLRGGYQSTPAAHASGSAFVRCDAAIARMPLSSDYVGKTLHIKVLPFNRYGGGMADLSSATDYTYVVTGVQAALAAVVKAQSDATAANTALTTISSDSVLSKGEKSTVILDHDTINGEHGPLDTQAGSLGVSTGAYDAALNALDTYLTGLSPAWNDTTQDTNIVAVTFRSKWSDYYTAKINLLNAIAAKIQTNAAAAQSAATNAQNSADAANTALANIASDNILSPSEKPAVVQDYTVITNEQAGIDSRATYYGITAAKTDYDTAVAALTTYLGTLSGWNTIPGGDVTIVGTTFRSKFADVYGNRQILLNAIATAAGGTSTWVGTTGAGKPADNATVGADASNFYALVGGDNLTPNASFEVAEPADANLAKGWGIWNNQSSTEPSTYALVAGRLIGLAQQVSWINNHTGTKGVYGVVNTRGWEPFKTYIISIYVKITDLAAPVPMLLTWTVPPATTVALNNPNLSTSWQRYSFKVTMGSSVEPNGYAYISVGYGSSHGSAQFDDCMVVEGDILPAYYGSVAEALATANSANSTLNSPPVISTISNVTATNVYKPAVTIATKTPGVTAGVGPFTYDWRVENVTVGDVDMTYTLSSASNTNDTCTIKAISQVTGGLPSQDKITVTVTDAKGRVSITQFTVNASC